MSSSSKGTASQRLAANTVNRKSAHSFSKGRESDLTERGTGRKSVLKGVKKQPRMGASDSKGSTSKATISHSSMSPGRIPQFVHAIERATTAQVIEWETVGISAEIVGEFSAAMGIPTLRLCSILGIASSTVSRKRRQGQPLSPSVSQTVLRIAHLLVVAKQLIDNSTHESARGFDPYKWLGRWLLVPQPALGGRQPAALVVAPTGALAVERVLGALESGAYV